MAGEIRNFEILQWVMPAVPFGKDQGSLWHAILSSGHGSLSFYRDCLESNAIRDRENLRAINKASFVVLAFWIVWHVENLQGK